MFVDKNVKIQKAENVIDKKVPEFLYLIILGNYIT